MRNVKYLILVLLVISSSVAFAGITINPVSCNGRYYWGYGTQGEGIGNGAMSFTAPDSHLVAWSQSEAGANVEWRVSIGYDVRSSVLGFNPGDVVSATLKFDTTGWVNGWRDMVTVDQTVSYLLGEDPWDFMYGYRLATGIVANEAAAGSHSVDITSAFLAAMNNASAAGGMSFVWYADNDADVDLGAGLVSPYNGNGTVVYTTGYTVDNARIEVTLIPEPMTVALLSLGGLFLRRRK